MKMKKVIAFFLALACAPLAFAARNERETDRVKDAGVVLKEILNIPDDIPKDLLDRAECVIVLPSVKKLAIGIGASFGRGVMVCRSGEHFTGAWGAVAMYALEGGNIGFQLGGQATDFLLLVMNPRGVESLLHSKVTLGADATVAAGPKGRAAMAATEMRASVLRITMPPVGMDFLDRRHRPRQRSIRRGACVSYGRAPFPELAFPRRTERGWT